MKNPCAQSSWDIHILDRIGKIDVTLPYILLDYVAFVLSSCISDNKAVDLQKKEKRKLVWNNIDLPK